MPSSIILPAIMAREVSLEVFLMKNTKLLFSNLWDIQIFKFQICTLYFLYRDIFVQLTRCKAKKADKMQDYTVSLPMSSHVVVDQAQYLHYHHEILA